MKNESTQTRTVRFNKLVNFRVSEEMFREIQNRKDLNMTSICRKAVERALKKDASGKQ